MPMTAPSEPIIRGTTWEMPITFRDSDDAVVDMTVSGRSLLLRFRVPLTDTIAFERDTETATEFTKTAWATGEGTWIVYSNDSDFTATSGKIRYEVDGYYVDTSVSPTERRHLGTTIWEVWDPALGDFS